MGTFHTDCAISNLSDRTQSRRTQSRTVQKVLVDTGSEYTWIPTSILDEVGVRREKKDVTFVMANGQTITRCIGFALARIQDFFTVDEVVFAEQGDLTSLGARSLEGFNARVDAQNRKLVAAGLLPAA